jgi:hypothetical protein
MLPAALHRQLQESERRVRAVACLSKDPTDMWVDGARGSGGGSARGASASPPLGSDGGLVKAWGLTLLGEPTPPAPSAAGGGRFAGPPPAARARPRTSQPHRGRQFLLQDGALVAPRLPSQAGAGAEAAGVGTGGTAAPRAHTAPWGAPRRSLVLALSDSDTALPASLLAEGAGGGSASFGGGSFGGGGGPGARPQRSPHKQQDGHRVPIGTTAAPPGAPEPLLSLWDPVGPSGSATSARGLAGLSTPVRPRPPRSAPQSSARRSPGPQRTLAFSLSATGVDMGMGGGDGDGMTDGGGPEGSDVGPGVAGSPRPPHSPRGGVQPPQPHPHKPPQARSRPPTAPASSGTGGYAHYRVRAGSGAHQGPGGSAAHSSGASAQHAPGSAGAVGAGAEAVAGSPAGLPRGGLTSQGTSTAWDWQRQAESVSAAARALATRGIPVRDLSPHDAHTAVGALARAPPLPPPRPAPRRRGMSACV